MGRIQKTGLVKDWFMCLIPVAPENEEFQGFYFLSNEDQSNAWMNLGGNDVKLELVRSTKPDKIKKGNFTQDFQANGLDVRLEYVVINAWEDTERHGYDFNSRIIISDRGKVLQKIDKPGTCSY
jgi:hypothetical protein